MKHPLQVIIVWLSFDIFSFSCSFKFKSVVPFVAWPEDVCAIFSSLPAYLSILVASWRYMFRKFTSYGFWLIFQFIMIKKKGNRRKILLLSNNLNCKIFMFKLIFASFNIMLITWAKNKVGTSKNWRHPLKLRITTNPHKVIVKDLTYKNKF